VFKITIRCDRRKSGKSTNPQVPEACSPAEQAQVSPNIGELSSIATRRGNQLRPMAQACQRADINPSASFHALRHHVDTRMVEKPYGHVAPSYVADAIRARAPKFGFTPDTSVVPLRG
jgi:hypothetical protein